MTMRNLLTAAAVSIAAFGTVLMPTPGHTFDLNIAIGADPGNMDARKTWVGQGYSINAHIFEPLVMREQVDGKIELKPVLAESWEQVSPTELRFKIREGVSFHNGEALNAEAVAETYRTIKTEEFGSNLSRWLAAVSDIRVEDDYTLTLVTKTPTRGLLNQLVQVPIAAPEAGKAEDFNTAPVGTGPYQFVSYDPGGQVTVEKFDGYWGTPGEAEKITFRILPEGSTRLAALETGEVHIAENISPDMRAEIDAKDDIDLVTSGTLRLNFLMINHNNPLFDDKAFREGISLAIDRDALVTALLGGATTTANSISPKGTIGHNTALPDYEYDLQRAKELIAGSSYDGQTITLGGPSGRYVQDKQVVEAIGGMLSSAGITVDTETQIMSSYWPKFAAAGYDLGFIGWTDFTVTPNAHWGPFFLSSSAMNGYSDTKMDELITAVSSETDDAAAMKLFADAQAYQREQFASTVPLYQEPQLIGVRANVEGFEPRIDEYLIVTNVTLSE